MPPFSRRGQTLVLFALTLLLLTLMVLLTLAIGMRAKEKIDLQNMADAAAYSNAVATARTLNSISVLNRAEVSHMVEMASVQSLISWSSMYLASLDRIELALKLKLASPTCLAPVNACMTAICAQYSTILANITTERTVRLQLANQNGAYQNADQNAGQQVQSIQGKSTDMFGVYETPLWDKLTDPNTGLLAKQNLAKAVITHAQQGNTKWANEISAPDEADKVSMRETSKTDGTFSCDGDAFACSPREKSRELGVKAMMGSRGYSFVTERAGGSGPIEAQITSKLLTGLIGVVPSVSDSGSGRVVSGWDQGAKPSGASDLHLPPGAAPVGAVGEDEGSVSLTTTMVAGGITCVDTAGGSIEAWVYSSDKTVSQNDVHEWTPAGSNDFGSDVNVYPNERHTLGTCTSCPGIWTMFIDLNPVHVADEAKHLWGQPKNYAYLERDYSDRSSTSSADPWNLNFMFRFTSNGSRYDNRGLKTLKSGLNIEKQGALAAGLAYYHRMDHWKEPPNFFNPFWRATLVSTAVDSQGDPNDPAGTDIVDTVGVTGATFHQDMVQTLKSKRFKGWQ